MNKLDDTLDDLFPIPDKDQPTPVPDIDAIHPDSRVWVWDLETGPQSKKRIDKWYTPPEKMEPFDPDSVKVGNLGAEKAEAKIEAKRLEHENLMTQEKETAAKHYELYQDMCALNPITGRILTSQYYFEDCDGEVYVAETGWKEDDEREAELLRDFWLRVLYTKACGGKIIGYNIANFDYPFAYQRSIRLGLSPPTGLMWKNRYLDDVFVDLYDIWKCGRRQKFSEAGGFKLSDVSKFLGLTSKTFESGADFWKHYKSTKTRAKALEYARVDVQIEAELARRLGVI